jgi:hypothetical protein
MVFEPVVERRMSLRNALRAGLMLVLVGGLASLSAAGGGAAVGPPGYAAVRGPAAVDSAGSYTNVYGCAYPYYGYGALAAGLAGAALVPQRPPHTTPVLPAILLPSLLRTALYAVHNPPPYLCQTLFYYVVGPFPVMRG